MNTKEFLAKFKNDMEKMKTQENATVKGRSPVSSESVWEVVTKATEVMN